MTDGPSQSDDRHGDLPDVQAVVVLPDAASATAEAQRTVLRRIAAERGWLVSWQDNPYLALADVCLYTRTASTRAGWEMHGPADPRGMVLVLTESVGAARAAALIKAARMYAPNVGIMVMRGEDVEEIAAVVLRPVERSESDADDVETEPTARRRLAPPGLRLTEPVDAADASAANEVSPVDDSEDGAEANVERAEDLRITQEEIEMLFEPTARQEGAS